MSSIIVAEPQVEVKWPGGNSTRVAVEAEQVVIREARHEDDSYRLQAIIPLQDAIQFAINLLEFVQATAHLTAEEEALLAWIRREEERREAAEAFQTHFGF